jgi:pimeloyl-ACP methyl ester carboxylesterase
VSTLERDGVRIAYEVSGHDGGLPLLLTHGYGSSQLAWARNLPALGTERRVITWDVRGHGESASPRSPSAYSVEACVADMAAVLDACGIERAAVGGLSLGGYLSLAFHLAHPERVGALLLVDTGPGYRDPAARARWNRWAEARAAAFDAKGLDALGAGREVATDHQDARGLALAARGILTQHTSEVLDALGAVAVPTLVLVGAEDAAFLAAASYLAGKVPGAVHVVLEGAGHAANVDQPQRFDAAVTSFLEGI